MGCWSFKEKICFNCQTPVRWGYTFNAECCIQKTRDDHHAVDLTSSTVINDSVLQNKGTAEQIDTNRSVQTEFEMGMIDAKTWPKMIDWKILKIMLKMPVVKHSEEPGTSNAWELMDALDDICPLRPAHHFRCFSFHVPINCLSFCSSDDRPTPLLKVEMEMDSFRSALEELPPTNPFHIKPMIAEQQQYDTALEENKSKHKNLDIPANKYRVVVYFTSIGVVRKTYEDCCQVRLILKGLGVRVDERDVTLHSGFKEELKELLRNGLAGSGLPRLFIGKQYIGGAEDIRRLNEEGKLEKMVEGCDYFEDRGIFGNVNGCKACGDIRFLPCQTCCSSCKLFYEGDYEDEQGCEENGFQTCPHCNENGLVRCPMCRD